MDKEAIGYVELFERDNPIPKKERRAETGLKSTERQGQEQARETITLLETATIQFSPPRREDFEKFYNELNQFNILSPELKNDILLLKTATHQISVHIRTVVELFAQVMETPINLPVSDTGWEPPFINNMNECVTDAVMWTLCEFHKIFSLNDPRIQKLCHNYHLTLSYPLLARLAYLEWENSQMGYKILAATKEIGEQKAIECRNNRLDYQKQLEKETTILKTLMNRAQTEVRETTTKLNVLNEMYINKKTECDNLKGDVEATHRKMKEGEAKSVALERQISELKQENKALSEKVTKQKADKAWIMDITYTPEKPVYRNKDTGEAMRFQKSIEIFKKEYEYVRKQEDKYVYLGKDGKEVMIPVALADEMVGESGKSRNSESIALDLNKIFVEKPEWKAIYEFIKSVGGEATTPEIATGLGTDISNLAKRSLKPMEKAHIIIGEMDGKTKRWSLPS